MVVGLVVHILNLYSQLTIKVGPWKHRFHVMVCRGSTEIPFMKHFLVGTPQTLFPCINPKALSPTSLPTPFSRHPSHHGPSGNLGTLGKAWVLIW